MKNKMIGVISDTHGLLREEAMQVLAGSDLIIHAGDVGSKEILNEIGNITELVAVRGNVDRGDWASDLPTTELVEFHGLYIHVIHDLNQIDIDLQAAGVDIVISGHSHKPDAKREQGILYVNPGSAGPKRFNLPISVAIIRKKSNRIEADIKILK